jgi:hypothetical protein
MANIFSVGCSWGDRERRIKEFLETDPSIALILASATFELMFKRFILKLGKSNTDELKDKLEKTWSFNNENKNLRKIWHEEIGQNYPNLSIKDVLKDFSNVIEPSKKKGKLNPCDVRGYLVHGNGSVSADAAKKATNDYLFAARFLYLYAETKGKNLDKRLVSRKDSKNISSKK